eukprot:PhF_6_TR20808/c0_g1_i1/m.29926/K20360/TBC1D22, GYP1; TBC1 domain family member 2
MESWQARQRRRSKNCTIKFCWIYRDTHYRCFVWMISELVWREFFTFGLSDTQQAGTSKVWMTLCTLFFYVFLESRWSVEAYQSLDTESLNTIEADTYWCAGTLLGWVQDHYTFAQPGIQLMVHRLQHVMQTADPDLYVHITDIGVNFMQFGYQWMHCLLVREVPLKVLFRLWDTYLAEGNGFADLHVFVCASLLLQWKDVIMGMHEFEGVLKYLQNPPTSGMSGKDVDAIVSRAYLLQIQYNGIK